MTRNPPKLSPQPDGKMGIRFHGIPGRTYIIQRSTDMLAWSTIDTVVAGPTGLIDITDPNPPDRRR